MMSEQQLILIIEALLFASSEPLTLDRIHQLLAEYKEDEIERGLEILVRNYEEDGARPFFIVKVAGGYQFRTRDRYAPFVKRMFERERLRRLSPAALETLSCIAYRQPATRAEIDEIRGVDSSGTLRGLMDRGLVRLAGRRKTPGKPLTYVTTRQFLTLFGLESLRDLPSLDELTPATEDSEQLSLLLPDNGGAQEPKEAVENLDDPTEEEADQQADAKAENTSDGSEVDSLPEEASAADPEGDQIAEAEIHATTGSESDDQPDGSDKDQTE